MMPTVAQQDGHPASPFRSGEPALAVTIHPDAYPLKWDTGTKLVTFISHYAGFFFDSPPPDGAYNYLNREEVEDAINYILLELIENAMKFNTAGDIEVGIIIRERELCFIVGNQIEPDDVSKLEAIFQEIHSDDPGELLVRRIEENAANPDSYESGLGFLTIMSDYGARLGWSFQRGVHPEHVRLTIMTRFPVYRSGA